MRICSFCTSVLLINVFGMMVISTSPLRAQARPDQAVVKAVNPPIDSQSSLVNTDTISVGMNSNQLSIFPSADSRDEWVTVVSVPPRIEPIGSLFVPLGIPLPTPIGHPPPPAPPAPTTSTVDVPFTVIKSNSSQALNIQQNSTGVGLQVNAVNNSAIIANTASTDTGSDTIHSTNHAPNGVALHAESLATNGGGDAILGVAAGDSGAGVVGEATQTSGSTTGVKGISASAGGVGILGSNSSNTGIAVGVRGESNSPNGIAGVFDALSGGTIISGRSAGVEKFNVDAQGNLTATTFSGDGSKLANINATLLGGFSAADFAKIGSLVGDGSQLANVNASSLQGFHASDFVPVGAPQNLSGLESLVSKQLQINSDPQVAAQFGTANFMREDQDIGHISGFRQAGPQMHFRLTRAYCDKTSTSQQSISDQENFLCVSDAVTIDDAHPAASTPNKDFIIAPYKFGMGIFYPGLIEVASTEFSVHAHSAASGAHLWVGDEHDLGGILITAHDAMNPDSTIDRSQSFVSLTSQTFTDTSHGDMLFSVRDLNDNFRFQFGPANAAEAPGVYPQYTKARIDSSGKGFFDGGTQTDGADFAESVSVSGEKSNYEPGDVLIIDRDSDRDFSLSNTAYSTLVAGIYSTKPGVTASLHSSEDPKLAMEIPIAIVGIVPCKVSTENGPINRGDLLVTSSTPGYAMRGTDKGMMAGAVVGKALQPFSGTRGKIEVLVTLQ